MSDYETFQLQWMIDHGHSLHELMEELQSLQYDDPEDSDQISTPITELFERWEQDRGFGSEIWPCEAEYDGCEGKTRLVGKSFCFSATMTACSTRLCIASETTTATGSRRASGTQR